jgi:hypothetical protein
MKAVTIYAAPVRATSSPAQFGQRPFIASAHPLQNVQSYEQARASSLRNG